MIFYTYFNRKIVRTGDLAPKGVKSTIKSEYDYNKTWEHIYKEIRKK